MFHEDSFDTRSYDERSWLFGELIRVVTEYLVRLRSRTSQVTAKEQNRQVDEVRRVSVEVAAKSFEATKAPTVVQVAAKAQKSAVLGSRQEGVEKASPDRVVHFVLRDDESNQEAQKTVSVQQNTNEIQRTKP